MLVRNSLHCLVECAVEARRVVRPRSAEEVCWHSQQSTLHSTQSDAAFAGLSAHNTPCYFHMVLACMLFNFLCSSNVHFSRKWAASPYHACPLLCACRMMFQVTLRKSVWCWCPQEALRFLHCCQEWYDYAECWITTNVSLHLYDGGTRLIVIIMCTFPLSPHLFLRYTCLCVCAHGIVVLQKEVGQFEPWLALDGGQGPGLDSLTPICSGAAKHLQPGGFLALETTGNAATYSSQG